MTRSPITYILIASMALNLILLGVFGGMALKGINPAYGNKTVSHSSALTTPTREERRLIRDILHQIHQEAASEREAHRAAKQAFFTTLSADTLDMSLAEAQFTALRQTEETMRTRMQADLLARLPDLPAGQRARIVHRLLGGDRSRRQHRQRKNPQQRR